VTHVAVTETKRLGAVLERINLNRIKVAPSPVKTGKQRTRYKPTGRRNDAWNSNLARRAKTRAASQGAGI